MLLPQCETALCLEHIEEIAAIEGVDGIFVGRMFYKIIQKNLAKQFGGGNSEGMEEFTKIIDGSWLCFAKTISIKCLE